MFGDDLAICGHRGAPVAEPENTLAGFQAAIDRGATWIEFDVRPAADGLVVHHDPVDSSGRRIADLTVAELGRSVPTFGQVIDQFGGRLGFDIELKADDIGIAHGHYVELVRAALGPVPAAQRLPNGSIVTSFEVDLIDLFAAAGSGYATGLVFESGPPDQVLAAATRAGHVAIGPWHELVDAAMVQAAAELGLGVFTWTVNEPAAIARVAAAGVDMIIGDDPAMIASTLAGT